MQSVKLLVNLGFHISSENIPTILIRFFDVIGPRQIANYGMVVPRFIKQACHHEPMTVDGDGHKLGLFVM